MLKDPARKRVLVFGASGTIGRACTAAIVRAGHGAVGFVRSGQRAIVDDLTQAGAEVRCGDATDPDSIRRDAFCGEAFDAVVSCLASRTGVVDDAWAIDYQANRDILKAAQASETRHVILLSAICVQRPRLAFQHAKLAFEQELITSGVTWSIVRPTAFFKSLSGQIARVRKGKPFLLFGDGRLTACKPISDSDLGDFIAACLDDTAKANRVLPIGGPGPAITPLDQGRMLFEVAGIEPRFRKVPVRMFDIIVALLAFAGRFSRKAAAKAEYARIGRYYATESMLLFDHETGKYDAGATPQTGSRTLREHYQEQWQSRVPDHH